jgi:hypothetical protein
MRDSSGDEAMALREELARLLGDMSVIELRALLLAITEIGRERARDQRKASARGPFVKGGGHKRRRTT